MNPLFSADAPRPDLDASVLAVPRPGVFDQDDAEGSRSSLNEHARDARDAGAAESSSGALVRFEQDGSRLTAVEITRDPRSPVMTSLHRALFALGIIVSCYQVRTDATRLTERVVIEREDGGYIEGSLSMAAKAVILPIALQDAGSGDGLPQCS